MRWLVNAMVAASLIAVVSSGCDESQPGATAEAQQASGSYKPNPVVPPVPPSGTVTPPAHDAATAAPSPMARKNLTHEEMEEILSGLRERAKTDHEAAAELSSHYQQLASPAFTASESYEQHIERLNQWKTALPESPSPRIVLADVYIGYAWQARGSGDASTVTDDGTHLFIQRIQDAKALLDSALELGAEDVHAYRLLVTVAMAQGLPLAQAREWYEAGRKLGPGYYLLHVQMAEYLRPEWHGQPGELEAFANQLVTDMPGDEGLSAFGHVVGSVNHYDWGRMFRGVYENENLIGAARVFLKRYSNEKAANYAALFAWAGGDMGLARQARERISEDGDPTVFATRDRFQRFETWCKVDKVPTGERARIWASLQTPVGLVFESDPRYIWCSNANGRTPVQRIDIESGRLDLQLYAADIDVTDIELSKSATMVASPIAGANMGGVVVWKTDDPLSPGLIPAQLECRKVAISPDETAIAMADGITVRLVSLDTAEQVPLILNCGGLAEAIEFSADGKLLAVRSPQLLTFFDTETGEQKQKLALTERALPPTWAAARPFFFDRWNRLTYLLQGKGFSVLRLDQDLRNPNVVYDSSDESIVAIPPDGKLLVETRLFASSPFALQVWDLERKKVVQKLEGHVCRISSLAFSPDGKRLATGSSDGELKIWDLEAALRSLETEERK